MKKTILVMAILWLIVSSVVFAQPDETVFQVTILNTNDFHGADMDLLARRATLIKKIRVHNSHLLLLDAGDVFTRGPYGKRFYGELEFAVMNQLQYDAMTLGNNEFKATNRVLAMQILGERIKQATFPILGANFINAETGEYFPGVRPYIIKDFEGLRIGIFGVTAPRAQSYSQIRGWRVLDPVAVSRQVVSELEGKTDIILALTHIGVDDDCGLAKQVTTIDAIIGGDSHTVLLEPEWVGNCPIVQAGDNGLYLGKLDLTFWKAADVWKLKEAKWELIRLIDEEIKPDPEILRIIDEYLSKPVKKAA